MYNFFNLQCIINKLKVENNLYLTWSLHAWWTLTNSCLGDQAPVVQRLDITIQRIAWFVLLTLIRWIAIYPVDSVIQPLNNRSLMNRHVIQLATGKVKFQTYGRKFNRPFHSTIIFKTFTPGPWTLN